MNTTQSKHTPGPWLNRLVKSQASHYGEKQSPSHQIEHESSGVVLARIPNSGKSLEARNVANARLIAAAPELLAALIDIIEPMAGIDASKFIPETAHRLKQAREAIAKATATIK